MEVLGIDIGGTGIKGAPVDIENGIFTQERLRIATPQPATPANVVETVNEIADYFNWKGPIGCGFPAVVKHDTVLTAANIDDSWIGKNVGKLVNEKTGCRTHVINDVDAAGLAEMTFGAGVGRKGTTIVVALGTGIGTSIFTDDYLVSNSEFGHIYLINGEKAELYTSNAVRKMKELDWKSWTKRLNKFFQYMDDLFWPDLFIVGGGVIKFHEKFLPDIKTRAEIVPAKLLNHAGIIGSSLAYSYSEGHGN